MGHADGGRLRMTTATATAVRTRPWRLGNKTRKATLVVHIVSAGAWFGLDVAMGVVVFTALLTDSEAKKALCYRALDIFVVWPLFTTGLICLGTGILLGLGTTYGLFRYWWVVAKLGLNLVLTALVPIALRPQVVTLADQGRRFAGGEIVDFAEKNIIFPPLVSPAALLIAFVLAVYKPWGRIRRNEPRRSEG